MPTPHRDLLHSDSNSEKIMHFPGSIIGNRYQIIQKLGREEMSRTYLAKDLQATGDARCAVEQLEPTFKNEANWQAIKQHFINEVAILERLGDHPQIPRFYRYFIENRQFYLVREYIDGDNLVQEVECKVFDEADAIYLIQDTLRILDFVHKTNVIHRNVQPIHLVRRKQDNSYVLINFGAIREIESTEINLKGDVLANKLFLNSGYTSPEQQAGQSHFSSDIYALAKTAVYALTGRSPLELESIQSSWLNQIQLSPKLKAILTKMMSSSIQERYRSAMEVLQDLRPLLKIKQVIGGRYSITRYLGGKAGIETYWADNLRRQYQSPCLIKQIELTDSPSDGKFKIERRFAEELSVLERLGYHDQIPQLWDHFEENDEFYLVQEYIQGENLAQKIEQQNLSIAEIIGILESTLVVLRFIHQNRIIHRNIKPSNLMIRHEDQQIILTDFGILADLNMGSNVTQDSLQNKDKQNYLSPEQIAGRPTINSDLYALGMTIIEALTQVKPATFPRNQQTGKILWSQDLVIDRRLVKIIDKMIHLDVGQRYQTADKVLNDLHRMNLSAPALMRQPLRIQNDTRNIEKFSHSKKPSLLPFLIGLSGTIFLLGSIEFAYPTVRPFYFWYQGQQVLNKNPQTALDRFTKAIDLKPQSALAWSGRGNALYKLELYSEALEAYYEAAELDSADFKNWQKQGDVLYSLERFTEAIAAYDRALELQQDDGELYNHKGKALYKLQRYQTALTMQEAALEIDRLNARFLSDRAKNLLALGRYYDALTVLNRVQAIDPSDLKLWQDKPLILKALNRPQEAVRVKQEIIHYYEQIIQKKPQNAQIWLHQGNFLAAEQMYSKAIKSYDRAIELKPNLYQAWLAKGKILTKLGEDQEALTALDQALQIRPQSYLAWQAKGIVHQNNQNNITKAISQYNKAIAINPNYAPLWRDRGLAFNQQGNYTQAIESLTQASKIAPHDIQNWLGLATAWDMIDQDQKALAALNRAIEIKPQDPMIWSQKGLIYTKNGQYNEACDTYRRSRLATPNSSQILDAMNTLGCRMN